MHLLHKFIYIWLYVHLLKDNFDNFHPKYMQFYLLISLQNIRLFVEKCIGA